jgi:predicted ABC-class ATPase
MLVDEDTSATNFMIRDARMQRLVPNEREPITPFVDQVQNIYKERGVSTILAVGGSGDYFDVADQVIAMYDYRPLVVTTEAKQVAKEFPTQRKSEVRCGFGNLAVRAVVSESLDPDRRGRVKVGARGIKAIEFGYETIELSAIEQLVDASQTEGVANVLLYGLERGYFDLETPIRAAMTRIYDDIAMKGIDVLSQFRRGHPGDYALPRQQEVMAALNRLRSLRIKQIGSW